ncbi:hypothetical protein [Cryobacterium sp. AP23]
MTTLTSSPVAPSNIAQAVLLAVLAGTVKAAEREIAAEVKARTRIFTHGNSQSFATDPQILQVVGEVSAQAFAAEAIVEKAAWALQGADLSSRPASFCGRYPRYGAESR